MDDNRCEVFSRVDHVRTTAGARDGRGEVISAPASQLGRSTRTTALSPASKWLVAESCRSVDVARIVWRLSLRRYRRNRGSSIGPWKATSMEAVAKTLGDQRGRVSPRPTCFGARSEGLRTAYSRSRSRR